MADPVYSWGVVRQVKFPGVKKPITESGWTGAGFIQIDPSTGAGAYTIEGGSNGSFLENIMATVNTASFNLSAMVGGSQLLDLYLSPAKLASSTGSIVGTLTSFYMNDIGSDLQSNYSNFCLTDTQG